MLLWCLWLLSPQEFKEYCARNSRKWVIQLWSVQYWQTLKQTCVLCFIAKTFSKCSDKKINKSRKKESCIRIRFCLPQFLFCPFTVWQVKSDSQVRAQDSHRSQFVRFVRVLWGICLCPNVTQVLCFKWMRLWSGGKHELTARFVGVV